MNQPELTARFGFLLSQEISAKLLDLVELSETEPYTIMSDAISTMWTHHFGVRRKSDGR